MGLTSTALSAPSSRTNGMAKLHSVVDIDDVTGRVRYGDFRNDVDDNFDANFLRVEPSADDGVVVSLLRQNVRLDQDPMIGALRLSLHATRGLRDLLTAILDDHHDRLCLQGVKK